MPDGWTVAAIDCGGDIVTGQTTAEVTLASDDDITCTFQNERDAAVIITPSYLVTRVKEGVLSGEGSKACYWLTLPASPGGDVVVEIDPSNLLSEVTVDKNSVTLNDSNWDNLTLSDRSNFLCVRAVDDAVDEPENEQCGDKSAAMTSDAMPYGQECGDHIEYIEHSVSQFSSAAGYDQNTSFVNNTLTNLGRPGENYLEALIRDNDVAGVILTESYAVSDLDEDGTPVGKACYWITLASKPTDTVSVGITADNTEVEIEGGKSNFDLDSTNWNQIGGASILNKVCILPIDENDIDGTNPNAHCKNGSTDMLGDDGAGPLVCGTHLGLVEHDVSSGDSKYDGTTNFSGNGYDDDGDASTINVLIRNDDQPNVTFTPGMVNVLEGSQVSYDVSLSARPTAKVLVQGDGKELAFMPATWNQAQTISVQAQQDNVAEAPETLLLDFKVSSADANFDKLVTKPMEVTVVDDDSAGVFLSTTELQVSEDGKTATYEILLTSQPVEAVNVQIKTDAQLSAAPAVLTFSGASWSVPQQVTVSGIDDLIAEEVLHSARIEHRVSSADKGYDGLEVAAIDAAIADNDAAGILVSAGDLRVSEDGQTATYTVQLLSQPAAEVLVQVNGGGEVSADTAELRFTAADWNRPQTVTLRAVDDLVDEGFSSTATLGHQVQSADPFYNGMAVEVVPVTVDDNDTAGLAISTTTLIIGLGKTGTYSVALTSQPTADVVVDLVSGGMAEATNDACIDGEGGQGCLLFTPANWDIPQTVTVRSYGKGQIVHRAASADGQYDRLEGGSVLVNDMYNVFMPVARGK